MQHKRSDGIGRCVSKHVSGCRITSIKATIDSSYLIIKIQQDNYKISLLNDSLVTTNSKKIDEFISDNKSKIIDNKIILMGAEDEPFKRVDKILNVLKKHEIFRYKLLTIPSK